MTQTEVLRNVIENDLICALENTESIPGLTVDGVTKPIRSDKVNIIYFSVGKDCFKISVESVQ